LVGATVRCPWHHARFNLEIGEATAAPALSPLTCWHVEERDGRVFVKGKRARTTPKAAGSANEHIVIVWRWRCRICRRRDAAPPRLSPGAITYAQQRRCSSVDRPNLSKDYLAGSAPEDWVPLRGDDWYAENKIDLQTQNRGDFP
jgi:hypothetical protein